MNLEFSRFLAARYSDIRTTFPQEGRRKWLLRALDAFWAANPPISKPSAATASEDQVISSEDADPLDQLLDDVDGGVVLRTDFSNDGAWAAFLSRLKVAEEEYAEANKPAERDEDTKMDGDDEQSDSESEASGQLIKVIDPSRPEDRSLFQNISNLGALRLLNDVDIRPAPTLPTGTKRISPPNRLVDRSGWQEIYSGLNIWIYDSRSNTDQSLRLVSQEGDVYGTATGDSWRAQVSHIYELQFNMTFLDMKINFGGLDRWDLTERTRNMAEAETV
ncbi:uncharacterized protein EV420DRAFT_1538675 [Desarmillaria tabescens]|uniref:Uncharacterized protein n=1 Tax=Armillaria tabescens TaxID=1929756 RepID=A0AA39KDI0_ARMTA|nr:uncharacterized protein EV420DRAFT_1538675 [Desarmillaria tabescens]KAK0459164.1 hypothetical protein EV420DRAFT_1538675 [Desarmillaria tabescens]